MKVKPYFLVAFLLIAFSVRAQQFNAYKYIVVPVKFDDFKNQNQYKTSTLIKYLLTKKGINTVYDDNLPDDINKNRCLGAYVALLDNSSLFRTKTALRFTDCNGVEFYRTSEGTTKEKTLEVAYRQAITQAVASMGSVAHTYTPKTEEAEPLAEQESVTLNFANDVKKMGASSKSKVDTEIILRQEATTTDQTYKAVEVGQSNFSKSVSTPAAPTSNQGPVLYAQPTKTGYQLVDTTPEVRYLLTSTSVPDIYLVEGMDSGSGLIFKKGGKWFLEYSNDGGTSVTEINIKF